MACQGSLQGAERYGLAVTEVQAVDVALFPGQVTQDATAQPQHDLRELSLRSDPPGLLARDLLALSENAQGAEARDLVHEARATLLRAARSRRVWTELDDPDTSDEALRERLLRAGFEALDELVAQAEVAP